MAHSYQQFFSSAKKNSEEQGSSKAKDSSLANSSRKSGQKKNLSGRHQAIDEKKQKTSGGSLPGSMDQYLDDYFREKNKMTLDEETLWAAMHSKKTSLDRQGRIHQKVKSKDSTRRKKIAKRKSQLWTNVGFVITSLGIMVGSWSILYPELFKDLFGSVRRDWPIVEWNIFGSVGANENKKTFDAQGVGKEVEKESGTSEEKNASEETHERDSHDPTNSMSQEGGGLEHLEKLLERKKELDRREAELDVLEKELIKQKSEVDKRIQKLKTIREQISSKLDDRVKLDAEKVKKLVGVYSSMKPKQAADILGTLNEDLAVEVIANMKKKDAAEIMNQLDSKKVKKLSEKFAGY